MKGPHERVKYDFRRLWECPVCKHRERAAGELPAHVCACQLTLPLPKQVVMRWVEEGGRRVIPQLPHPAASGSTASEAAVVAAAVDAAVVSPPLPAAPSVIDASAAPDLAGNEPRIDPTDPQ